MEKNIETESNRYLYSRSIKSKVIRWLPKHTIWRRMPAVNVPHAAPHTISSRHSFARLMCSKQELHIVHATPFQSSTFMQLCYRLWILHKWAIENIRSRYAMPTCLDGQLVSHNEVINCLLSLLLTSIFTAWLEEFHQTIISIKNKCCDNCICIQNVNLPEKRLCRVLLLPKMQ